jgi:hypothetical protein
MFSKYYIAVKPQTNEYHSVHKDDCPFLPAAGKRIELGSFDSPNDALEEGHKLFYRAKCCLFCSAEKQSEPVENELFEVLDFPKKKFSDLCTIAWESALMCSVN